MRLLSSLSSFLMFVPRIDVLPYLLASIALVATAAGFRYVPRQLMRFYLRVPWGIDRNLAVATTRISAVLVAVIGLSITAGFLGFSGIPFITVGTIGIVVGLSFQSTATSMVNGLWVLGEESFHVGDTLIVAPEPPYTGVVEDMQIRYIQMRTPDGKKLIVPNNVIISTVLEVERGKTPVV